VENRIREIVGLGEILTTMHYRTRMRERSFSFQDLVSVLLDGRVKDRPEYDEKRNQHRYRVEGTTVDGGSTVAVTVILSLRSLLIVTIFEGADLESS
jgi:hypothetical protein